MRFDDDHGVIVVELISRFEGKFDIALMTTLRKGIMLSALAFIISRQIHFRTNWDQVGIITNSIIMIIQDCHEKLSPHIIYQR